jgi:hypothetical protein
MNLRKDVRDLISLNEKIQSALLQGESITHDEAIIIRQCAIELLEKFPAPQSKHVGHDGEGIKRGPL